MRSVLFYVAAMLPPAASTVPALASTTAELREFNARVTRACVAASGIRDYRASSIVSFDDRVGMVAMLVSDRMRGSTQSKLCLYDKRVRRAHVVDAEMWFAPPQVAAPPRR